MVVGFYLFVLMGFFSEKEMPVVLSWRSTLGRHYSLFISDFQILAISHEVMGKVVVEEEEEADYWNVVCDRKVAK